MILPLGSTLGKNAFPFLSAPANWQKPVYDHGTPLPSMRRCVVSPKSSVGAGEFDIGGLRESCEAEPPYLGSGFG